MSSEEKEQRLVNEESSLINHLKKISQKENFIVNAQEGKTNLYFEDFKILSKITLTNLTLLNFYLDTDSSGTQLIRRATVNKERVACLIEGINLYKKFDTNISTNSKFKVLDPDSSFIVPEKYGYAIRNLKLNMTEKTIEVKNLKMKITGNRLIILTIY